MSNHTSSFRDGYVMVQVERATIGGQRDINKKDKAARNREMEIGRRKMVTFQKVSKMVYFQKRANEILRASRSKLQKTPQLHYYPTTATHSVYASNIRGNNRFR